MEERHDIDNKTAELRNAFISYKNSGRLVEALNIGDILTKLMPENADIWFDQGIILRYLGESEKSLPYFRASLAIEPNMFVALIFLGHTLLEQCRWYDTWQEAGFKREPWSTRDFCDTSDQSHFANGSVVIAELYNLGLDLGNAGYFAESAACHQSVTKFCPDLIHAHYGLASMLLATRQYREALPALREWNERSRKNLNAPYWYGGDITDKILYIYADHGLGDIVQFIRYVQIAAKKCRKTLLYIPPSLHRAFGNIQNIEIVSRIDQPFDLMCSLFLLPHAVGIDESALGGMVPYLHAEPALVEHWKRQLPEEGVRIGIAWQGNPTSLFDQGRSIPLACFAPLARLPNVRLISLQMNHGLDQLERLPDGMEVTTLGPGFNAGPDNVVDTAAVMKNLDLIISTDTSVPHIAGALGCPIWVLLKAAPDWRWQLEREDCPWYPTMRLFRQKRAGEWDEVMARVAAAAAALPGVRATR